jgi:hypothetical protein
MPNRFSAGAVPVGMNLHISRTAWLAAAVSALSLGFLPAASAASASEPGPNIGDPIPAEFGDCFGPYSDILIGSPVIYAEPWPTVTWGTSGNDVIIGSDGNDYILGVGGNDRICAGDGNDHVEGGLIVGGSGVNDVDLIDGGTGSDILHGGQMNDYIYGGSNFSPADEYQTHDFLYGDDGDDDLYGEGGPDGLDGGTGYDDCDGGTGMAGNRPEADFATGSCNTIVNVP